MMGLSQWCRALLTAACAVLFAACASVGPANLPKDRIGYVRSIAESWKQQTLLNIVRVRYGDNSVFLDVSSVTTSHSRETELNAETAFSLPKLAPFAFNNAIGAQQTYIDKPTISYTPLKGDQFARSMIRPLAPSLVFSLIQSGYPADILLRTTAKSINGIANLEIGPRMGRAPDPRFKLVVGTLHKLQAAGLLSLRFVKRKDGTQAFLSLTRRVPSHLRKDARQLTSILNLQPKAGEVHVVYGLRRHLRSELAIQTRSMAEILRFMSKGIMVPKEHIAQGRTFSVEPAMLPLGRPDITVHTGQSQPKSSYTQVNYKGTWYWIRDEDYGSKSALTFMQLLFSLSSSSVAPQAPVLTISAN